MDGTIEGPAVSIEAENDILPGLLRGYRFSVCEGPQAAVQALEVRRRVYVEDCGYDVPVPDAYDARSWFLLAEDVESGQAVGSMRLTPRFAGPFELEEYFRLPRALRSPKSVELNRFAILPKYRKGTTFLPVVSLGMFKTVMEFMRGLGAQQLVIASKAKRVWTYEWLRFRRTGVLAQYGTLDGVEHELLTYDFRRADATFEGHPFEALFTRMHYGEVVLPRQLPPLGLGINLIEAEPLRKCA